MAQMLTESFLLPLAHEKNFDQDSGSENSELAMAALQKLEEKLRQAAQRRTEFHESRRTQKRARTNNSESPTKNPALRRAELVALLECRMITAAAKREQRNIELAKAAHYLNLVRERRRLAAREHRDRILAEFIEASTVPLAGLSGTGLLDGDSAAIEKLMMTDPVKCIHCVKKEDLRKKACPVSSEPHFRTLIILSKQLLECASRAHLSLKRNLVMNPDSGSSGAHDVKIAPHPSLLVRAVHAASCRASEVNDDELHIAAIDVATCLKALRQCVLDRDIQSDDSSSGIAKVLLSFQHKWKRWVSIMSDTDRINRGAKTREALKEQLIESILKLDAAQAFRLSDIAQKPATRPGLAERRLALTEAIEAQLHQLVADLKVIGGDAAIHELRHRRLQRFDETKEVILQSEQCY